MYSLTFNNKSFYPQALSTGLNSRISKDPDNALIQYTAPTGRAAKRNTQQINYAEFDNYNDDFEYEENPTPNPNSSNIVVNTQIQQQPTQKHLLKPARGTPYLKDLEDEQKLSETIHKKGDILIPIKLNLEYNNGNSRLIDFFMWNYGESLITPQQFALILCNDLELPSSLQLEIVDSINKQIEDYNFVTTLQLPPNMEFHVIIDLSVSLDKKLFQDRFEWDLEQNDVTPEEFSDIVVSDLGLSLEFKPAISHSLHETILRLKREIAEGSYNHELHKYQQLGGLIFERGIRITTESSTHNGNDHWEPIVEILTPWEIEKREIEKERNIRRLKRENVRREVDDFSSTKRRALLNRRKFDELEGSWKSF